MTEFNGQCQSPYNADTHLEVFFMFERLKNFTIGWNIATFRKVLLCVVGEIIATFPKSSLFLVLLISVFLMYKISVHRVLLCVLSLRKKYNNSQINLGSEEELIKSFY